MGKFARLLQEYRLILLLAVLCGGIYVAPHLYFKSTLGSSFHGIELAPRDAEANYMSMVNEVTQGYPTHSSTYLYEYKDTKVPLFEYSETFYGSILGALHGSVSEFYVFSEFFFSMLMFLLWYAFSLLVTKSKRTATLSALLLVFGYYILSNLSITKQLSVLFWRSTAVPLLAYGRFANPLLTFPFFFAGLVFAYRLFSENTRKTMLYFGIALGILFYVYFYFWAYLLALSFLMMLFGVYKKEWLLVKNIVLSILIAFSIGSYFILDMVKVAFGSVGVQTGGALSPYVLSHSAVFPNLIVLGLMGLVIFVYAKRKRGEAVARGEWFLFLLLGTAIIAVNQQVLTGRAIEPGHFHWYASIPVFFLVASYIASSLLERISTKYFRESLFILMCLYVIAFGVGTQISGYKQSQNDFVYYQNYGPVFDWLNKNTERESVVFGEGDFASLVPVYTRNNVYFSPFTVYDPNDPFERRVHTAYVYYFLDHKKKEVLGKIYPFTILGNCSDTGCIDSDLFRKIMSNYGVFLKTPFYKNLKAYKIDYVVWDKNKDPEWNLDTFSFLKSVYTAGDIEVYKIL